MEEFLGYLVLGLATLIGLFWTAQKFLEPINALNLAVQELRDYIGSLKEDDERQNADIKEHTKEIDKLKDRVGKVETKIDMYHK